MTNNHISRLAAPKSWNIQRKKLKFITKPSPGAHGKDLGIALNVLLKEITGVVKTNREVRYAVFEKNVLVDNKQRKDIRFVVGLMDSVSVPDADIYFRILLDNHGKIFALPIEKAESSVKLCKIIGKNSYKKKIQINLHDGKNILVDKDAYKVGDSVLLNLPKQDIKQHVKLEKGCLALVVDGKFVGQKVVVEDIKDSKLKIKVKDRVVEVSKNHIFVVGKDKPLIKVD